MFNFHLKNGETVRLDLENGTAELARKLSRAEFQDQITAVTVVQRHPSKGGGDLGVQYSLARPEGFEGRQWFHVEHIPASGKVRGGEKLTVFAGDIRVTLMAHRAQPALRVTIAKVGSRKYNPEEEL